MFVLGLNCNGLDRSIRVSVTIVLTFNVPLIVTTAELVIELPKITSPLFFTVKRGVLSVTTEISLFV